MSKAPIFTKLFGPSPIVPIQQHMNLCEQSADTLIPFLESAIAGNWEAAEAQAVCIAKLENEADEIKKTIRMNLPRSLFLPMSRSDLLELLQVQDRIANASRDVAGLAIGRRMSFPDGIHEALRSLLASSVAAVNLARKALDELNDLIITGFSGQEVEFIEKILERLHEAEHDSDVKQVEVRRQLFALEAELNPVDVVFIYKVIDRIGDVADDAQTVGNRMMYLIAS